MESGASDHTGWSRKRIIECVLEWFGISYCINISVKSLLCSIKRLQIQIYKRSEFCEECNRKVLSAMNSSAKNQTLPADLFLVIALPDVIHLGKSLNCSWADQFIDLEGAISNFVQYAPCVILEALIFAENLGNALPSIVCETKIAWQLNQSCTLPDLQSYMFQKK